jgi:hypothetical protein
VCRLLKVAAIVRRSLPRDPVKRHTECTRSAESNVAGDVVLTRTSRLHCSKYRNGCWVEYHQIGSDVIERASGLADIFPNRRADEFLEAAA